MFKIVQQCSQLHLCFVVSSINISTNFSLFVCSNGLLLSLSVPIPSNVGLGFSLRDGVFGALVRPEKISLLTTVNTGHNNTGQQFETNFLVDEQKDHF